MHILIVTAFFPSRRFPARGTYVLDQARLLAAAGHQVGVVVLPEFYHWPFWQTPFRLAGQLIHEKASFCWEEDIAVFRCGGAYTSRWLQLTAAWYRKQGLRMIETYCRQQGKPGVCHAHFAFLAGYCSAFFSQKTGVPLVLTEHHSAFLSESLSPMQAKIAVLTFAETQRLYAVSPALAAGMQPYLRNGDIHVLGNAVDGQQFPLCPEPAAPFSFGILGNFNANKGNMLALRAFAALPAHHGQKPVFHMGGDGPLRPACEKLAGSLGISDRVKFHGLISRHKVVDFWQNCHVAVSASHRETFAVPLIEAMSCGRPAVATASGGPNAFIHPSNGILCRSQNRDALSQAMTSMMRNYHTFNGEDIRRHCLHQFGNKAVLKALEHGYQSVLLEKGVP